ncbi:zinc knuckle CX2CX4HX4C containing protein [Tanacetum coccineum]
MNDHLKAHRNFQQVMDDSMSKLRETFQTWLQQRQEQVVNLDTYTPEPSQYRKIPICYDDDDDEYSFATQEYLKKFSSAITPDLPKSDSLIMEDKHLDTIPETESDELIKSSVEDLVHTPSESDGISESECDLPVCDDSSPKKDEVLDDIISIPPNSLILLPLLSSQWRLTSKPISYAGAAVLKEIGRLDTSLLKEELTRIPIWVKLHDVPIQVFEEDGISLIATFIGKPVMLDSYTSSMCNDSWGRSSFARCLIVVNSEADLVDVVTIGIPSLTGDGFTKETIRVEYEWRPPRCDICKIFGHVHDHCPKKVVSPPIVVTSTVEKTNDDFQTMGKRKKNGKSKSTNGGQFGGPSVKQTVRYEPKATTSAPKKGATNVSNLSKSSSMMKITITSTKKGNIATSNPALEYESDEDFENIYDKSDNLFQSSKTGESSSIFTAAAC